MRAMRQIGLSVAMGCGAVLSSGRAQADGDAVSKVVSSLDPASSVKDRAGDGPSAASSWASRPRSVNLMGGTGGGPLGFGGFGFEYAPVPWVVLGGGGGWSPNGVTGAFIPRLRLPVTPWLAVGAGVPFSLGPYEYVFEQSEQCLSAGCSTSLRTKRSWGVAYWGHIEPNVEFRLGGGLALRTYAGYSKLLNVHDDVCTSSSPGGCPSRLGEQRWYGGLALGYAW